MRASINAYQLRSARAIRSLDIVPVVSRFILPAASRFMLPVASRFMLPVASRFTVPVASRFTVPVELPGCGFCMPGLLGAGDAGFVGSFCMVDLGVTPAGLLVLVCAYAKLIAPTTVAAAAVETKSFVAFMVALLKIRK